MVTNLNLFYKSKNRDESECIFCFPLPELIVKEFADFMVIVDTHPISKGHLLLITKLHYGCFGDLPIVIRSEIEDFLLQIKRPFILYEHGRAGACGLQENICEHFHFNIIFPSVGNNKIANTLSGFKIDSFEDLVEYYQKSGNYLFLKTENEGYILTEPRKPPKHYLRTVVATSFGSPELSDWESYNYPELFSQNLEAVRGMLL